MEVAQNQWLSTAQSILSMIFWLLTSFLYHAARILYKFLYILMVPLMYPIYYVFNVVLFLLSPLWITVKMISSMALWTVGLVAKLKYLYIYFTIAGMIGVLAACVMHGTSSIIFVTLGIVPSDQKQQPHRQPQRALPPRPQRQELEARMEEDGDDDEYEEGQSPGSSPRLSGSSSGLGLKGSLSEDRLLVTDEMLEEQWRRARSTKMSPIKPSRRFRGLLAQTIHEESSESESL